MLVPWDARAYILAFRTQLVKNNAALCSATSCGYERLVRLARGFSGHVFRQKPLLGTPTGTPLRVSGHVFPEFKSPC